MSPFLLGFLICLPLLVPVLATVMLWRSIRSRMLFLVTAALSLMGLQSVIAPVTTSLFLFSCMEGAASKSALLDAHSRSVYAGALLVMVIGILYLWWMRFVFIKK